MLKRQRTVQGRLLRDLERKLTGAAHERKTQLHVWIQRAWRICRQRPENKGKLYVLYASEVECIGKGKARQRYEFSVKVRLAIAEKQGVDHRCADIFGLGRGISSRGLIALLSHSLKEPVDVSFSPSRGFDVPSNVLDISRAKRLLGWSQTVSLEEGLSRYIAYLKDYTGDHAASVAPRP